MDGDGDNDYCITNTWYDCNADTECQAGYFCSSNDCVICTASECADHSNCRTGGACCDDDAECGAGRICVGDEFSEYLHCGDEYKCRDVESLSMGTWSGEAKMAAAGPPTCGDHAYDVPENDGVNGDVCIRFNIYDGDSHSNVAGVSLNHDTDEYSPTSTATSENWDYNFIKDYDSITTADFVQMPAQRKRSY